MRHSSVARSSVGFPIDLVLARPPVPAYTSDGVTHGKIPARNNARYNLC